MNCRSATTATIRSNSGAVIVPSHGGSERVFVCASTVDDRHGDAKQPPIDDEFVAMMVPMV
jgi:hypothetical protein